jgi:hypothetical protein
MSDDSGEKVTVSEVQDDFSLLMWTLIHQVVDGSTRRGGSTSCTTIAEDAEGRCSRKQE